MGMGETAPRLEGTRITRIGGCRTALPAFLHLGDRKGPAPLFTASEVSVDTHDQGNTLRFRRPFLWPYPRPNISFDLAVRARVTVPLPYRDSLARWRRRPIACSPLFYAEAHIAIRRSRHGGSR